MGSNKENVLVAGSDDDSEEEVFFGDMSEKEKRKAAKYARRRTALHTPNFRSDRKLMRCTMGPGELGAVLEEGGAAGDDAASSVCEGAEHDPSCVESDAKEVNAMSNGVVVGDTQNNVNNNSSAAMDTCEEGCEDSVTVTAEDVNELIELVPKLELTDTEVNGNVLTEHDCEQQVSDTASCVQRSPSPSEGEETAAAEIPSRNESAKEKVQDKDEVSPVETAVTASCDTESSSDASDEEAACDAQTAQPVELPTVSPEAPPHGGDDECHSDAAVFKTPLQTPAVSFNSPDEISFKTPAAAPQNPEGEAAETPVWRPKLMGLDTDTPTVQFKTAKPTQQTAHVHLPTARESESEETPTVQLKNSCSMDPDKTPTVQFKTPSCGKGDQSETPATQPGKEAGNAAAPSPAPQLPAVEPRGRDTGGGDTPTISFKPKHRTPTVLPPNSTKIGFKRSSTSAFQVTPQRSEVRSPQHRVLEWPAPRPDGYPVVFKEVNFSPTLKVTDVKDDAATADEPEKLPNPRDSFDFHEREVEHRDDLSPELYSPAWEAGASAAAPAFAFPAQRGGWSLDSALRTWPPRLIPEETLPRLDWDDDEDDDTSPGAYRVTTTSIPVLWHRYLGSQPECVCVCVCGGGVEGASSFVMLHQLTCISCEEVPISVKFSQLWFLELLGRKQTRDSLGTF